MNTEKLNKKLVTIARWAAEAYEQADAIAYEHYTEVLELLVGGENLIALLEQGEAQMMQEIEEDESPK